MKRPLIIPLFCVISALVGSGVLLIAITNKASYDANFEPWYFYTIVSLLVLWLISNIGLFFLRFWSVLLASSVLLIHQIVIAVVGVWGVEHLPLILIPLGLFLWLEYKDHLIR